VLDAQHFGVPQRRRRVFVVGHLGDWRRAASVLFERESLSRYPTKVRKDGELAPPAFDGCTEARTVALRGREGGATAELGGTVATALRASQGGGDKPYILADRIRRLSPVECERLQGFPEDWTKVTAATKDGPRYKAIGNSMAVPVMRWIGEGIAAVSSLSP
jgi:DNA (cytosine-5)-methyltransferase 1